MTRLRTTLLALALAFGASGCTINNSRSLGQECLQDRECNAGLLCLPDPSADGRTTCQPAHDGGSVLLGGDARAAEAGGDDSATAEAGGDDAATSEAGGDDAGAAE